MNHLLNHELQFVIYCFRTRDNWFCSQKKNVVETRSKFFFGRVSENFPNFSFFGARFFFFSAHPGKTISVNHAAKTVKDRKISKTYLNLCDTQVPPVDKN